MNWVDCVLWAVMALSGLWGLARGVVKEGFALLGWVLGFFASSAYASELVQRWPFVTWAEPLRWPLAWLALFLLVMVITALLAMVLKEALSWVGLGLVDRLLGLAFGLLRGLLVWMAVALVVGFTPWRSSVAWTASSAAQFAHQCWVVVKPDLPASFERWVV